MLKIRAKTLVNMKFPLPPAMRSLHGSIEMSVIVQPQQWDHVCPNKTAGCRGWWSGRKKKVRQEMAYVNSTRQVSVSFGDRIVALAKVTAQAWQRRRVYLQTLRELDALDDRDLRDMGLSRSEVRALAHEAAYGR